MPGRSTSATIFPALAIIARQHFLKWGDLALQTLSRQQQLMYSQQLTSKHSVLPSWLFGLAIVQVVIVAHALHENCGHTMPVSLSKFSRLGNLSMAVHD